MQHQVIVITGGATGIGFALLEKLAPQNTVISLDRNPYKITQLQKMLPTVVSFQTDITQENEVDQALQQITAGYGKIDLLINNAGAGKIMDFEKSTYPDLKTVLETEITTNYLAPILLTKKALPLLHKSAEPLVVFVTSGLAYTPIADFAGYCASKAAMHSFAQSLRHQLKNSPINVVEVLPPTVDTDFNKEIEAPKISPEQFASAFLHQLSRTKKSINIGQSATLHLFSRYFPDLAFRVLNKKH